MRPLFAVSLAGVIALGGCATTARTPGPSVSLVEPEDRPEGDWREVALPADRERLSAAAAPSADGVKASGLYDPGLSLPHAALTPGRYRCRVQRVGRAGRANTRRDQTSTCFVGVDNGQLTFTQETGDRRVGGRLWRDTDVRQVFLGATLRAGLPPVAYGVDAARSRFGVVRRIGDMRWRLVLATNDGGSEAVELVPLAPELLSADPDNRRRRPGR